MDIPANMETGPTRTGVVVTESLATADGHGAVTDSRANSVAGPCAVSACRPGPSGLRGAN